MPGQVQKRNYQRELDQIIDKLEKEGEKPRLLLHSCCAPCSSYVLEYLSKYFQITIFYYNPNIYPAAEYEERVEEQQRLISQMAERGGLSGPVELLRGEYVPADFYQAVKGRETDKEGGEPCLRCYQLRLREAAQKAAQEGFDYFTTTLSISPMKNSGKLNEIGEQLAAEYQVPYLVSDFKKKNGYKRSTELSGQYGLYRQDYCGCIFSLRERRAVNDQRQAAKSCPETAD